MNQLDLFRSNTKSVDDIESSGSVTLRPYQNESVDAVFSEWEAGNRSTLVVLPTGTGKSVVFSEVMRRYISEGCR